MKPPADPRVHVPMEEVKAMRSFEFLVSLFIKWFCCGNKSQSSSCPSDVRGVCPVWVHIHLLLTQSDLYTSSKTEWDEVSDFHQSNIWTSVCGVVCESVCVCPCGLSGVCVRESVCLCSNDTETVLSARITLSFFFYQNQHHVFPNSFCSNYTRQYLNTSDHK